MVKCSACGKSVKRPNAVLILHKAEGLQVYSVCSNTVCLEFLGHAIADGAR